MIAWLAPIGGLAVLAGLPLVIHLLSRQTRREWPFPALALLRRATGGRAQISALRERVALLLRMLALAALLLAAAAPVWHASWVGSDAPVVILIDASASMHQRVGATDAWTEALGTASRLADETAPRPAMVFVAGSPLRRSSPQPEADRGALRALLADARPGWGAGSLDAAVAAALSSMAGRGDLYVITDGSRNALAGVDPGALPSGIAWHHVAVTGGGANCAIRAIALEPGGARVGRPLQVQAEVANFGPEAAALTVRLTIGESCTEQPVTVPPGGSVTVSRTFVPERAGVLPVEVA